MNLSISDLGKTFSYDGHPPFLFEGIERHGDIIYAFGTGRGFGGSRPTSPAFPAKLYYMLCDASTKLSFADYFEEVSKEEDCFDFKRFGCYEKSVRDLVEVLDKRYKREN